MAIGCVQIPSISWDCSPEASPKCCSSRRASGLISVRKCKTLSMSDSGRNLFPSPQHQVWGERLRGLGFSTSIFQVISFSHGPLWLALFAEPLAHSREEASQGAGLGSAVTWTSSDPTAPAMAGTTAQLLQVLT